MHSTQKQRASSGEHESVTVEMVMATSLRQYTEFRVGPCVNLRTAKRTSKNQF